MQYIPVTEDFVIQLHRQYCALESEVGPFRFIISGSINSWQPSTGAMDFQFTAVDILLLGNKVGVDTLSSRGVSLGVVRVAHLRQLAMISPGLPLLRACLLLLVLVVCARSGK
jgi:hypothetical protein